jgi:hypothetical protein
MDVKSDFLDENLTEEIYMEKLLGFEEDFSVLCRLKKTLYGLK